jgi:hypothetical protein
MAEGNVYMFVLIKISEIWFIKYLMLSLEIRISFDS